jgi:hypothetical protein
MDPFTIAGSSLTLAKLCVGIGWELKKFIDDTKLAGTAINALFQDLNNFEKILEQMKALFDDPEIKASFPLSGYLGSHWQHLHLTLDDAKEILTALQTTAVRINKHVNFLDATRKHIRLKGATDEIAIYQQKIRLCKDTIQISLQTTILYVIEEAIILVNLPTDILSQLVPSFCERIVRKGSPSSGYSTGNNS